MVAKVEASAPARGDKQDEMRQIIDRAIFLEEQGDLDGAVGCYEEALLAGFATVEVCYNLAVLYKQQLLYEDALTLLQRCLDSAEYGASAHYASGECQLALGNLAAAGEHFDRAVSRLAFDQIADDQVAEVSHVLRVAIDTFTSLDNRDRAAELSATLDSFIAAHPGARPASTAGKPVVSSPVQAAPAVGPRYQNGATPPADAAPQLAPAPGDEGAFDTPTPDRATTTGRLRMVYRRATGPLTPVPNNDARRHTSALLGRVNAAKAQAGSTALTPAKTSLMPPMTAHFERQPVQFRPTIPLTGETAQPAEIRALLSRTAEDILQKHFAAAIDDCHQIMVLAPEYFPIHLRLGEIYALQGRLAEAAVKCDQLMQFYTSTGQQSELLSVHRLLSLLDPTDLTARQTMADLYFSQAPGNGPDLSADVRGLIEAAEAAGEAELAIDYAERLVTRRPDDRAAILLAARLHLWTGNAHRALAHCQALLRRDRQDTLAIGGANAALTLIDNTVHWPSLETLVATLQAAPDAAWRDCFAFYEAVLSKLEPARRGNLQVALGLLALRHEQMNEAVRYLKYVPQTGINPQSLRPPVRFALAYGLKQPYAALNDGPAERQWLQHAADLLRDERVRAFVDQTRLFGEPISVGGLHVALAESLVRGGKADNAAIVLEAAKADLPDDATIRRRLAAIYHERGRLGQALDELDDLSTRQLNAGQLDEMITTLHQMSAMAGNNLKIKTHIADRYLKRGCPDDALDEFAAIAAIHQRAGRPDDAANILRQAADTAWMIGQHDRAFTLYDQVLALAPENVMLRQAYINCLLQAGRQQEAADQQRAIARQFWETRRVQETIAALHQVIVLDPRDAESYSQLGEALASVGEYAQAERVYRRLVRLTPDDPIAKAKQAAMAMLAREQA
ncbi:MAG: tetratricopeptide repeat protein [Thermomicrobiales bacterium]